MRCSRIEAEGNSVSSKFNAFHTRIMGAIGCLTILIHVHKLYGVELDAVIDVFVYVTIPYLLQKLY
jgi:hypothetical protein